VPRLLQASAEDLLGDEVDVEVTEAEEREMRGRFNPPVQGPTDPDLSDGGRYGAAKVTPYVNGRPAAKGRPAARQAWTWEGSESVLPLAWNPDGTVHDGGRRYLAKRVCLCCRTAGWKPSARYNMRCPQCASTNCTKCQAGADQSRSWKDDNGKAHRGEVVPCFYLRKEQVPFQVKFYGSVNCFLETCRRRGGLGFKTEADMRMHATGVHAGEYKIWQEMAAAAKGDEVANLREQVNQLMMAMTARPQAVVESPRLPRTDEERQKRNEAARSARAKRKAKREAATIQ
jgi:hypothetical protein